MKGLVYFWRLFFLLVVFAFGEIFVGNMHRLVVLGCSKELHWVAVRYVVPPRGKKKNAMGFQLSCFSWFFFSGKHSVFSVSLGCFLCSW